MENTSFDKKGWKYFMLGGAISGVLTCLYNFLIFKVLGFYPEVLKEFEGQFFDFGNPLLLIFLKNFFAGFVLAYLFRHACFQINKKTGQGITYFILYGIFAFLMFGLGDIYLLRRFEGVFLILTVDGFVETMLCMIPVRILSRDCFD